MVKGQGWNKNNQKDSKVSESNTSGSTASGKSYRYTMYWHPDCWVKQGIGYLKKHPYIGRGGPGRPKTNMSDDDRKTRAVLLARYGNVNRRRKRRVSLGLTLDNDKDDREVEAIAELIRRVGGVPGSWNV